MSNIMLWINLGAIICLGVCYLLQRYFFQCQSLKKKLSVAQYELANERQRYHLLSEELTDIKRRFEHQVLVDSLTGTVSRQVFEDRLMQTINQSKRHQLTFAVMQLAIDEFKMINDVLGYDAGDELLREVTKRLQSCMRQLDTLSRFGGDFFALILPQLGKPEVAIYIAKRFLEAVAQPFRIQEQELYVTASIGIAIYPSDSEDPKFLLQYADSALNQAKQQGRNVFQFYRQEMQEQGRRELMLYSSLRNPEIYNELILYYQPQVDLTKKSIVGIDTTVCWHHGKLGLISSSDFFHLMEYSGKMLEIGEWLFRQALSQFQSHGLQSKQIAIPISLRQLESSHFIYKISQILQELQIDPTHLILEIAENTFTFSESVKKACHMIKHLSIRMAIAHFGAGHLALLDIEKLPVEYLKIDRSLIQKLGENKQDDTLIQTIITMAANLNITVIADGVQNEHQKSLLQQWGCGLMQGELFGPLLSGKDLEKVI